MKYTKEQIKIMKDFLEQKNEHARMSKDKRWEWKIRGYISTIHYWLIAYGLPVSLLIWIFTQDYWKALAFLTYTQIYAVAGNLRGLGLHIENFVEWNITKRT